MTTSVRTMLFVSLVLMADLEMLILLEPTAWVALTIIIMAAMAFLVVRIVRVLIHPRKESNENGSKGGL